jgi:phosphoribosyl 1,2-cyclic phosphodiesterase
MSAEPALRIRFWGVRGSHPVPGPSTARVGGNSSCVEVIAGGRTFVFDAGTGIIGLGNALLERNGDHSVHIFLSHTHHDHIEGLRFFEPVYRPEWRCVLYGASSGPTALQRVFATVMQPSLFHVALSELPTPPVFRALGKREHIRFPGRLPVEVLAQHSKAHPKIGVTLYRVTCKGRSVVYATDVEAPEGGHKDVVEIARSADVLIHDAQYTDEEYSGGELIKAGWGHSTVRMAAEAARAADVGELILYHHDPSHNDAEMRRIEKMARTIFPRTRAATEGLELRLTPR